MRTRGFTLIEVMVAMAILAIVSTLVWSTFRETSRTKQNVEAQAARYRTVRIALDRMSRELAMAFLSQNEDTAQPERRTRFVGKRHTDVDELTFSYFGHQRLYEDAPEGDTAVVSYTSEPDRDHRGGINLMRRETRRLGYGKPEELSGQRDILCDDVVRLKVDYYDSRDKTWREDWNTTSADGQPDRLPSKIKITLTVHDERGKEVPFQTQTRVFMQEPLNLKAVDAQQPATNTNPAAGTPSTTPGAAAAASTRPITSPTTGTSR